MIGEITELVPSWTNKHFTLDDLRRWTLLYGVFLAGLGLVLQFLQIAPVFRSIPSPFLVPFLPVIVVGVAYWVGSGRYRDSIAIWLVLGVIIIWMIGSSQPFSTVSFLMSVFTMIAIHALIVDERDWIIASRWFLVGFILFAIILLSSYLFSSQFTEITGAIIYGRLGWMRQSDGSPLMDPNLVGFHAGFGVLVALTVLTNKRSSKGENAPRRLAIIASGLAVVIIALTQSLGSSASIVGALGVSILFGRYLFNKRTWISIAGVVTAIAVALAIIQPAILERLTWERVSTATGRTNIWRSSYEVITQDVPTLLFGAGTLDGPLALGRHDPGLRVQLSAGGPPQVSSAGDSITVGVHSTYFTLALEYGLIGMMIVAVALLFAIIRAMKVDKGKAVALGIGMVAFFLLISVSQTGYALSGVSIGCGGIALGYLYHRRPADESLSSQPITREGCKRFSSPPVCSPGVWRG